MDEPSTSEGNFGTPGRYGKNNEEKNEAQIRHEEEIVKLCRQMDEKLEDRAKAHNFSAINVKSLLHVSCCNIFAYFFFSGCCLLEEALRKVKKKT